jgi:hypothetical protein
MSREGFLWNIHGLYERYFSRMCLEEMSKIKQRSQLALDDSENDYLLQYCWLEKSGLVQGVTITYMIYDSGSQTVRRGALGCRKIFKYFHWNDT